MSVYIEKAMTLLQAERERIDNALSALVTDTTKPKRKPRTNGQTNGHTEHPHGGGAGITEAVLRAVQRSHGPVTAATINSRLVGAKGNSVYVTLARLAEQGRIKKVGRATYSKETK